MAKVILYHGSQEEPVVPVFGFENGRNDYGKGFYLSESLELAKEWAVCKPLNIDGRVHKYELDLTELDVLDFDNTDIFAWIAELLRHRDAADSRRYRILAKKFIDKYGIITDGYDVIKGRRADASFFLIAREFAGDNIDADILEKVLFAGESGVQYCIKSEKAYSHLKEIPDFILPVSYAKYNEKYNRRDITARRNMYGIINSDENKAEKVFSTLLGE